MKAAWQLKTEWEETNFLRLITLTKRCHNLFYFLLKKVNLTTSVLLFIAYLSVKFVFAFTYIIFAATPIAREAKDETWMFRQIK